jgi:ubiquinone/menaquinone biosynthesis C-methylase UbiE
MDDKQWRVFFEIHSGLPREGPGDNESTRRAFSILRDLPENPQILDIGCGPGMQTIELAKLSKGTVTALDKYPQFLDELQKKAIEEGVNERIRTIQGDMFSLNFERKSFDLIWSEGAIYIIGFEKGLSEWKQLLSDKGYLVVTEVSWIKHNPPEEIRKYWEANYSAIRTVEENLETVTKVGYINVSHFVLPERCWWDNYYTLIASKTQSLKQKYRDDAEALNVLACEEAEIDMFRRYSDYYGYVFYI